jgi:ubiquinone/menaquinone biosynthesis C-methylase UbiE
MGLYSKYVLPRLVHAACSSRANTVQRKRVVPRAEGRVLEVGIGSGLNLPFYDTTKVTRILGLDPSLELTGMARESARELDVPVEFLPVPGEEIPLENGSVDTVLVTYTLCSIADVRTALSEMRRVLTPGGRLVFCEHGRSSDRGTFRWQRRLDPVWSRFSGGCHLDRDIPALIEDAGFSVEEMRAEFIPGWKPASFNYWGSARTV